MRGRRAAERLVWAVDTLQVRPTERLFGPAPSAWLFRRFRAAVCTGSYSCDAGRWGGA